MLVREGTLLGPSAAGRPRPACPLTLRLDARRDYAEAVDGLARGGVYRAVALGAGHRHQDDAGFPFRHLAGPGTKPPPGLPRTPRFPSSLNCYVTPTLTLPLGRRNYPSPQPSPRGRGTSGIPQHLDHFQSGAPSPIPCPRGRGDSQVICCSGHTA